MTSANLYIVIGDGWHPVYLAILYLIVIFIWTKQIKKCKNVIFDFISFQDEGTENSEPFLGLTTKTTDENDDYVVIKSSASLHDPICEVPTSIEKDELAGSEPQLAVYNPIYEAPSVDAKSSIQVAADDLKQASRENIPESTTDNHESHHSQPTEDETSKISENTTVQVRLYRLCRCSIVSSSFSSC